MSRFVVTRGRGAPDPSSPAQSVGSQVFYQLWQKCLHPYESLKDGDVVYWGDQKSRELRWEFRVVNVRRAYCRDRTQFEGYLRHWFGLLVTDLEYDLGRETGWLLAWENELMRPLDARLAQGARFGRSGIREMSDDEARQLRLPSPATTPMIAVDKVDGPVPVFGPGSRRAIQPALRRKVFARDGHQCRHCKATDGPFHLDHIFPFSKGGPTDERNLQVLCAACNLSKGARVDGQAMPEQLLPDSEVERCIVAAGEQRPVTVNEAASILERLIADGRVDVDDTGLAAMSTLTDLNYDSEAVTAFVEAFARTGDEQWSLLLSALPDRQRSDEIIEANHEVLMSLLENDGVLGDATAAVIAPSLAYQMVDNPMTDESAALAQRIVVRLRDHKDPSLRGRMNMLIPTLVGLDGPLGRLFDDLIGSLFDPSVHPFRETALLLLAQQLDDSTSHTADLVVTCASSAAFSQDPGVVEEACELLCRALECRSEPGDTDAAQMYRELAARLSSERQSPQDGLD